MGVDIRHLIVRDGNGNFYQGAEISAGAATELEPMERLPAMKLIREQLLLNVPELPPGLSPVTYDPRRQRGFRTKRTNGVFYDQNHPPLFLEKGMLHRRLQALQLPPGGKLPLVESSYLAFTEQAPEIDTGIEGCREVGSFHVVEGRW